MRLGRKGSPPVTCGAAPQLLRKACLCEGQESPWRPAQTLVPRGSLREAALPGALGRGCSPFTRDLTLIPLFGRLWDAEATRSGRSHRAGQPRAPYGLQPDPASCSWTLLWELVPTEAPGGAAPSFCSPAGQPQLLQGLSLGRNGHQLGVGERIEGWGWGGEEGNRPYLGWNCWSASSLLSVLLCLL